MNVFLQTVIWTVLKENADLVKKKEYSLNSDIRIKKNAYFFKNTVTYCF